MTEHSGGIPIGVAQPNKKLRGCLIAGLAGVLLLAVVVVAFGIHAVRTAEDEPVLVTGLEIDKVKIPGYYSLSTEQQTMLSENGYPDSFLLLFYEKILSSGQRTQVREETWYYPRSGYEITYRNGAKYTEAYQEPETEDIFQTVYRPEMFIREMAMEQVLAAAGQDTYMEDPVEKILLVNADLYFTEGLVFGVSDGELRYLETVPLNSDEGEK